MKTYKGHVMKTNVPNRNGMLYPSEVMDKAIKQFNEKIEGKRAVGELKVQEHSFKTQEEYVANGRTINSQNVSHVITKLERVGEDINCELQVLDTPNGRILQNIIDAFECEGLLNEIVTIGARGVGEVRDVTVVDYTFIAIDIFPKE